MTPFDDGVGRRVVDVPAERPRVLVVVGSGSDGRTGARIAEGVRERLRQELQYEPPVLHTSDLDLPPDPRQSLTPAQSEVLTSTSRLLQWASSVIIVTPEYNRSFPASLKTFIDWHRWEWAATVVAIVSYGGLSRGLCAVEQLRLVLAELHATTVREAVALGPAQTAGSRDVLSRAETSASFHRMLDHLTWWDDAVSRALQRNPYPSGVERQRESG